jgi:hypothetical protein
VVPQGNVYYPLEDLELTPSSPLAFLLSRPEASVDKCKNAFTWDSSKRLFQLSPQIFPATAFLYEGMLRERLEQVCSPNEKFGYLAIKRTTSTDHDVGPEEGKKRP